MKIIDHNALRFNQFMIVSLASIGFLLNNIWFVLLTASVTLLGSVFSTPGFKPLYTYLLQPLGILKPDLVEDDPFAHRFAQMVATIFLSVGVLLYLTGYQTAGWSFALFVVLLALINLFTGFCLGCFFYFQIGKLRKRAR